METRLSEELTVISSKLMLANEKAEILRLVNDINNSIEKLIEKEKSGLPIRPQAKSISGTLKFTQKEISKMATTFKKIFIANGLVAHITKRESGKGSYCYEIRYRANGYKIEASSTDLVTAKKKFLAKTLPGEIEKYYIGSIENPKIPTTFDKFALYYFENYRKRTVAPSTYKNDCNRLKTQLLPYFKNIELKKIDPSSCQDLLDNLMEQGKAKTAVEAYNLLSCIFKNAMAHNLIFKNPLSIVLKPRYDQQNGTAFTLEEETRLLNALNGSKFNVLIALALYCGLRPNELETAQIDGEFIKAVNSKRHTKDKNNIEYKWIPITERLKPFLQNGIPTLPPLNAARKFIANIFPNHKLYDCRTTFYSRCKECGVDQRALNEYMGHSLGKVEKAYTDLSKEFLLKEGKKIKY
ncbi:MAG: tyrosine-type recombinase/integrase family protein [Clostridia bacterium]|nr:tyrosine-type recombinase/integrase family protein [Clostridia bacterium]